MSAGRQLPRWPLFLIAAPAAVAVWSGWVGLGGMCGFGLVHPLPGIVGGLQLDTAITLPVGVEAYGAYALGAWLTPGTPERARAFARRSAIGALALGMLGQVVYHLLAAAHATRAPWPVVVLVSCLPVVTLGFGAALTHLLALRAEARRSTSVPGRTRCRTRPARAERPRARRRPSCSPPTSRPGDVPGIRAIRSGLHVGQDKASQVQAYLRRSQPAGRSIRRIRRRAPPGRRSWPIYPVSTRPGACPTAAPGPGLSRRRRPS